MPKQSRQMISSIFAYGDIFTYVHSEIFSTLGRDNPNDVLSLDGDVPLVVRIHPEGRMVSR